MITRIIIAVLLMLALSLNGMEELPAEYKNFNQWARACWDKKLQIKAGLYHTPLNKEIFDKTAQEFIRIHKESSLAKKESWFDGKDLNYVEFDPNKTMLNKDRYSTRDNLFIKKLILQRDSEIAVVTDLHGQVLSLVSLLEDLAKRGYLDRDDPFKISEDKKNSFYLVFLGDYTDRGRYGVEVLYTLMRLKIANPQNVILLRGNHENARNNIAGEDSLVHETRDKLWVFSFEEFAKRIVSLYDLMPSALYIGTTDIEGVTNYAMLSHAGDITYDANLQDNTHLFNRDKILYNPAKFLNSHKEYERIDTLGKAEGSLFVMRDFIFEDDTIRVAKGGRGDIDWKVGKFLLEDFLNAVNSPNHQVKVMLRGHQHGDMLVKKIEENHGIYGLWLPKDQQWDGKNPILLSKVGFNREKNSLWTFYSSTIIPGDGNLLFPILQDEKLQVQFIPTYVILKMGKTFHSWQLEPRHIEAPIIAEKIKILDQEISGKLREWFNKLEEIKKIKAKKKEPKALGKNIKKVLEQAGEIDGTIRRLKFEKRRLSQELRQLV